MIELEVSRSHHRNASRCSGDLMPCAVCGRAVKLANTTAWVRMFYGSTVVTPAEAAAILAREGGSGDLGCYPVGPDCLRQHPELEPYVQRWAAGAPEPVALPFPFVKRAASGMSTAFYGPLVGGDWAVLTLYDHGDVLTGHIPASRLPVRRKAATAEQQAQALEAWRSIRPWQAWMRLAQCACGGAGCPHCTPPLLDQLSEEERAAGLVVQAMERYGQPPADLALVCPDGGQGSCQGEPAPALPELADLYAQFCDVLRRYKDLPAALRPVDGAELLGHIRERLHRARHDDLKIAIGQLDELAGWLDGCTPPHPNEAPHQFRIGDRLVGPNGAAGSVERRLGFNDRERWYWVRLDVPDADRLPGAGWPFDPAYAVWAESEVQREQDVRNAALTARYNELAPRAGPRDTTSRAVVLRLAHAQRALQSARWAGPSDLVQRRLQRAAEALDALEAELGRVEPGSLQATGEEC